MSLSTKVFIVAVLFGNLDISSENYLDEFDFPPKFEPSNDPAIPAGHLKPFGYQKPPDGPVEEYKHVVHPLKLWEEHVSKNKPAVFRQAIGQSSAILKWSDDYLKANYGDLDVLIELKKENRSYEARRTTLATFIDNYKEKDIYVVTVLPDPMRKEIQVPACLLCGSFVDLIHETNFWMSSGGTRSLIHFDADHILHCLVAGRKDWIVMNQEHFDNLYMERKARLSGSGYTVINPDKIDMLKYPKVANVSWQYTTLYPGDCLFFPSEYIHLVRSYTRSISATMLFTTDNDTFVDRGCDKIDLNSVVTLDQVHVHWTYNKGDNVIEMGYMNIEMLRNTLLESMRRFRTEKLTTKLFEKFWYYSMDEESDASKARWVFKTLFDRDNKGFLTKDEVVKLPVDTLKELARIMDPPHGPKTEDKNYDGRKISEPRLSDKNERTLKDMDEDKEANDEKYQNEGEDDELENEIMSDEREKVVQNQSEEEVENATGNDGLNGRDYGAKIPNESPEEATVDAKHTEL